MTRQTVGAAALTLTAVQADRDGHSLHLAFADGAEFTVDLQPIIERYPSLRSLGAAATFRRAKLGPWGATVTWGTDALELAADNLRARALEQGAGVSNELIIEWMSRNGMTLESAAGALGLSRRTLAYDHSGEREILRTVHLACTGRDASYQSKAA